jgi:hypothetical protein
MAGVSVVRGDLTRFGGRAKKKDLKDIKDTKDGFVRVCPFSP